MSRAIYIIGAGGHALSVAEAVVASGLDLEGFVGLSRPEAGILPRPVLDAVPRQHVVSGGGLVLGLGDNATRENAATGLARYGADVFPVIVHPSASVSRFSRIAPGTVVLQMATIGSGATVGEFALLNTGSVLDHQCELGAFASLAPGAVVGGHVVIGARTAIGIGATVKHEVAIGSDVVLGAHSYLNSDLPENVVAYGCPARVVRDRRQGEPYLQ